MRISLIPLAALGATALVASAALAQADNPSGTVLSGSASVTPSKAGTKKKPQGVKLVVKLKWTTPDANDKPVTQSADVLFPKGSLYNGSKYPKCTQEAMSRGGIKACPAKSIMGTGSGTAYADTVLTSPQITVVNGGGGKVFLFTVLSNPARVAAPVPGTITRQTGQWAYKVHFEVPQSLQVVAGVPIALRDLTVTAGGKPWAKDWLATTGCTAGKWPYSLKMFFDNGGTAGFDSSTACTS